MIQTSTKYLNDIIVNGTHINRIYNDGKIYWGNEPDTGGLPARYVQVDYIMNDCDHVRNSSGSVYPSSSTYKKAYIDTNYFPKINTRVVGKIELPANRYFYFHWSNVYLFGGHTWAAYGQPNRRGSSAIFGLYFYNNNRNMPTIFAINNGAYGYNDNQAAFSSAPNNSMTVNDTLPHMIEFEISADYLYEKIDDVVYIDQAPVGPPWPDIDGTSNTSSQLYLFSGVWEPWLYNYPSQQPIGWVQQKLYYFKIYEGNILVKDYIPVYDTVTEKYGLYDLVGNEFLTSSTSYDFIYE